MHFHSCRVSPIINVFLFELRLNFKAGGWSLLLLYSILNTNSFLHVHGVGPFALHLENKDLQILLSPHRMWHIYNFLIKFLLLLFLISTLLQELHRLPQPMNFSNTILVIAGVVIMPQSILILWRLYHKERLMSIRLQHFLLLFRFIFFTLLVLHFCIFHLVVVRHFNRFLIKCKS